MKEMKSQVKAKAARNLDMLVHRSESPFTKRIDDYPFPAKFKVSELENFDGLRDSLDYLDSFKTVIRLQGVSDEIMCRAFPTNLRGLARVWFNQLETESIDTFTQLSRAFIDNFIGGRRSVHPANYLLNIRQREGESLRSYVQRFNKEAVQIDEPNEFVALTEFNVGLRKGDFLFQLCKDPSRSVSELMYEAQKFINVEDAFEAWDEFPSKKRKEPEDRRFKSSKNRFSKSDYSKIDRKNDDPALKWPEKLRSSPGRRSKDLYCRFYRDYGHNTEDCFVLNEQIEALIRQGKKTYARQAHNILVTRKPRKNLKLDDQMVTFSEDDARGIHQPHDDALVVTMTIAGFITRQVLIDNESSADIIYLPAYQQMKIDKERLRPIDIPLVGFTGDKVNPSGVVSLMIEAGTYPKQVTTSVEFLVVDCPSAYNVIIGRPTLNKLRAVTLTYHIFVCFLIEHGIKELKGDQVAARECYFASLGPETKHQTMVIGEGQKLVEPIEKLEVIVLDDEKPDKTTNIGTKMDGRVKKALIKFLRDNTDVFAWTHEDMSGIDPSVICHKLNVDSSMRPIKQKRRVFAPDRNQAISDEVGKLLTAGFIKEVYYLDWLANVVMVKKSNDKWRMCVDFTDLNKVCLKDSFPLPRINQLVNPAAGHKLLTLMDVFSGKFLGFMVSQRGIEANPDKIKAILEMTPSRTVKEVQSLIGRVAALNRFVSRAIDKCLPFFKTLRKAFTCTDECQKSFEELKKYLTFPPLLSPSKQGEPLFLYLTVSLTAISSALIREEDGVQLPVYYTSKSFQGVEERYPTMEKLALALVVAARKLRPYFQAHTIIALTNHPLHKAMSKPDAAG
uniref:Reverse transcriptase/retrotransposon-derived protein RNase H-like domain-containing protein n=1 Tax=Fagus sylvatica TaxID=28930 RepID=A0A2N9GHQ1_FAGSY